MEKTGKWEEVKTLYRHSLFFRTLIDNSEMSMKKCFFPLTAYLAKDPKFGEVWKMVYDEYELTQKMALRLSGQTELMGSYPMELLSIQMRERIVLPLVTIQQYCISKVREMENKNQNETIKDVYEKLVMRCSFGIINAGRNSA
jgi:phosphoenolpyruvate carboxylase